jgi:hypothetical protein
LHEEKRNVQYHIWNISSITPYLYQIRGRFLHTGIDTLFVFCSWSLMQSLMRVNRYQWSPLASRLKQIHKRIRCQVSFTTFSSAIDATMGAI